MVSLAAGTRLGPYEIVGPLGAGGMGEVYHATDTRLDRKVAVKVLPGHLASDPLRRERFEREAKAVSSLNHPHICTLFDVGEHDGTHYLVMELVDGETLQQRLQQRRLALDQALEYAIQIAAALDQAHREGVVHRDLKPSNIMLTGSAGVKVLDFGLARLGVGSPVAPFSQLTTQGESEPLTEKGAIIGTLQYMAPEQLEGRQTDARTDIFAFGTIIYEMVTGKRAFEGRSRASLMAAILERKPAPMSALQPAASPELDRLLDACVAKAPEDRWRSVGDVGRQLAWIRQSASDTAIDAPAGRAARAHRPFAASTLAAFVLGSVITGLAVWSLTSPEPPAPAVVVRSLVTPSTGPVFTRTDVNVALTPDGSRLVYRSEQPGQGAALFVRSLSEAEPTLLVRGEEPPARPRHPFISPDGERVGFYQSRALHWVSIRGGPPVTIVELSRESLRGAAWSGDAAIIFATAANATGLRRVPVAGGEPEVLTRPNPDTDELDHRWPEVLPGGEAVLFEIATNKGPEDSRIAVLTLADKQIRELLVGGTNPRYVRTGHIVYGFEGTLRAVGFDLEELKVTTDPVPLVDGVAMGLRGGVNFTVAQNGSLVYVGGEARAEVGGYALVWVDRAGNEEPLGVEIDFYSSPQLSPDGTRVVFAKRDGTGPTGSILVYDIARRRTTPVTSTGTNSAPIWSHDGQSVVFTSARHGTPNLYQKAADGSGDAERLTEGSETHIARSTDGRTLVFRAGNAMDALSLDDERVRRRVLSADVVGPRMRLSPDGRWLAYEAAETGGIDVVPFPDVDAGRWRVVSDEVARAPVWSADGRTLFYKVADAVIGVPVTTEPSFDFGDPEVIIEGRYVVGTGGLGFNVTPDGRRFLIVKSLNPAAPDLTSPEVFLVQNWLEELKERLPVQ